ncbi:MAG: hypothetical protein M4579_004129 [Chaenotheca gracillima]|nr:MAG: hypothetical protein M4579_004129 [Chaenotheca gracillima]
MDTNNIFIAWIYCSYKEKSEQTAANLIGSLLKQHVERRGFVPDTVSNFYNGHEKNRTRPNHAELVKILRSEIEHYSKIFLVVDALDECQDDNEGTRSILINELRSLPGDLSILFTTRHQGLIPPISNGVNRIEIKAIEQDVSRYVQGRIKNEKRLRTSLGDDPSLRQDIVDGIVKNVDGIQLYDTYDEAMARIEEQSPEEIELAEQILSWICYAVRPLTIGELQHALAVEPEDHEIVPDAITNESIISLVCAGLVVIDAETNIVHLVHNTTEEYFQHIRMERFPNAQQRITATCLTYLTFDAFGVGPCEDNTAYRMRLEYYPFYLYAAQNWAKHAEAGAEQTIIDTHFKLFANEAMLSSCVQAMMVGVPQYYTRSQDFTRQSSLIHLTAQLGLSSALELYLQSGMTANSKDSSGFTPLLYATQRDHEAIVRLLVKRADVDVNLEDPNGRSPLSYAAEAGHENIVDLLLSRKDTKANLSDQKARNAISYAAEMGHQAIVHRLLQEEGISADLAAQPNRRTPMSYAAGGGHENVVRLLLKRKEVRKDSQDEDWATPLAHASVKGAAHVVQLLLDSGGVNADSRDAYGWTPLSKAAAAGHEAVVRILINRKDVDANSRDEKLRTPLWWATKRRHSKMVGLLLELANVDPGARDSYGLTPSALAREWGDEEAYRALRHWGEKTLGHGLQMHSDLRARYLHPP